jgi:hypothetical protein
MFRLVSLFGIACLAVAAVALSKPSTSASNENPSQDDGCTETPHRLRAPVTAVLPACPRFHARFSMN